MADEVEVLVHLREFRTELKEMRGEIGELRGQVFEVKDRMERVEKRLGDVYEASMFSVGVAVMTSRKLEQITDRLDNHEQRVTTLEDA